MSSIVWIAVVFLGLPQQCASTGQPAWSANLRTVLSGCDTNIPSTTKLYVARITSDGQLLVQRGTQILQGKTRIMIEPPAMLAWHPREPTLFINDGEGSGMTSVFRLVRIVTDDLIEDGVVQRLSVQMFRELQKCPKEAADPNVWGLGWSPDGQHIYLLVQATANRPCGRPGAYIGLKVNPTSGEIIERMSAAVLRERFNDLLPNELRSRR